MRIHIHVLYSIVVILLTLQILSFISLTSQTSKIIAEQEKLKQEFKNEVEELKQENQFNINEIVGTVAKQKSDVESEIQLLKDSQKDFSDVIDKVIKEVVNVRTDKSAGTGFIVDSRGHIVTNLHVISGGSFVKVQTYDGQIYDAVLIGEDSLTDLALLKIPGFFDYIELVDSDEVEVGEKVIAIGNPLGLSFSVTEGIVSAVDRTGPNGLNSYIQTDVTLNPGNSGGPLINQEGKTIGVNNFKIGGAESLGFALESNVIRERINSLANQTIIN
jgi:S1-C subfamily serine protease